MGVLYNDTSTRRTFYISRIIDEEMKKGDLFVITGMSGAELAIRVLDIPDDDIIIPSSSRHNTSSGGSTFHNISKSRNTNVWHSIISGWCIGSCAVIT